MDARAFCRNQNSDLARIRNQEENQELQTLQEQQSRVSWSWMFWTGLSRSAWTWTDSYEATFTPWTPNRGGVSGSNRCAVLQVQGGSAGMVDTSCSSKKNFICYKGKNFSNTCTLYLYL